MIGDNSCSSHDAHQTPNLRATEAETCNTFRTAQEPIVATKVTDTCRHDARVSIHPRMRITFHNKSEMWAGNNIRDRSPRNISRAVSAPTLVQREEGVWPRWRWLPPSRVGVCAPPCNVKKKQKESNMIN